MALYALPMSNWTRLPETRKLQITITYGIMCTMLSGVRMLSARVRDAVENLYP